MGNDRTNKDWLGSKETRKQLGNSSCELSHVREDGKLRYRKEGNAYRYLKSDVRKSTKKISHEVFVGRFTALWFRPK